MWLGLVMAASIAQAGDFYPHDQFATVYVSGGTGIVDANDLYFPGEPLGWSGGAGFVGGYNWVGVRMEYQIQGHSLPPGATGLASELGIVAKSPLEHAPILGALLDPNEQGGGFLETGVQVVIPVPGHWKPARHRVHADLIWAAGWRFFGPPLLEVGMRIESNGALPGERALPVRLYLGFGAAVKNE